jgi:hypothetical protein
MGKKGLEDLPVPVLAEPKSSSPENGRGLVGEAREAHLDKTEAGSRGGQEVLKELVVVGVPFNPRMVECVDDDGGSELVYVGNNKMLAIGDVLLCKPLEGQEGFWEFVKMVDERIACDERGLPRDKRRPWG